MRSTERRDWSREFGSLPAEMATGRVQFLQDHPDPEQDERSVVTSLRAMTNNQDGELMVTATGVVVIQRPRHEDLGDQVCDLARTRSLRYGDTIMDLYRREARQEDSQDASP